jgi:hypothetical protein
VWAVSEHLLAIVSNWLAELTYVTTVVNTDEKHRKSVQRPEPIVRPGEKQPERRHHRRARTVAIDPRSIGGAPIETTGEEVRP